MRKRSFILIVIAFLTRIHAQDTLTFSCTYQGKNIYVGNPMVEEKVYCAMHVLVNGVTHMDSLQRTPAFEIDLSSFKLHDPLIVQIVHTKDCKPKILNPMGYHHFPFKFKSIKISETECFVSTIDETPDGKIVFEIFRYNEWTEFRTEKGKGSKILNNYTIPFRPHAGKNLIRVKFIEKNGRIAYSSVNEFLNNREKLELLESDEDTILLSYETEYELLNEKGKSMRKAVGTKIPMNRYPEGIYFLHADNQVFRIKRKK